MRNSPWAELTNETKTNNCSWTGGWFSLFCSLLTLFIFHVSVIAPPPHTPLVSHSLWGLCCLSPHHCPQPITLYKQSQSHTIPSVILKPLCISCSHLNYTLHHSLHTYRIQQHRIMRTMDLLDLPWHTCSFRMWVWTFSLFSVFVLLLIWFVWILVGAWCLVYNVKFYTFSFPGKNSK